MGSLAPLTRSVGTFMLTFPWHTTAKIDRTRQYVGLLGLVQLRSILLLPTFVQYGFRIDRQLRRTQGVVGFRVAADFVNLKFYHLSAWIDVAAIDSFVRTDPHLRAMQTLTGRLGTTAFRYWDVDASDIPLQSSREFQRLERTVQF